MHAHQEALRSDSHMQRTEGSEYRDLAAGAIGNTCWEDLTAAHGVCDAAHIALVSLLERLMGLSCSKLSHMHVSVAEPETVSGLNIHTCTHTASWDFLSHTMYYKTFLLPCGRKII